MLQRLAGISYVVIVAGKTHKPEFQLLISSSGPFPACGLYSAHNTVIYSLVPPAAEAADEIGITPEDGHFSSPNRWTNAERCITLHVAISCCRTKCEELSVLPHLPGHNKMVHLKKKE